MSLCVLTLWRSDWTQNQADVATYLANEAFPKEAHFLWIVEKGSEARSALDDCASQVGFGERIVEIQEVVLPKSCSKHFLVAALYNFAFTRIPPEIREVLVIEDDVVAPVGTLSMLLDEWRQLPSNAAACMVAYRSRNKPGFCCAGDLRTGYIPFNTNQKSPISVNWIGGGYTIYRASALTACLPVVAEHKGTWYRGWDVDLCAKFKARNLTCYLLPRIQADHRF